MLLPIWPPSAAPTVTPGTREMAEVSDVEPCDCISALVMTVTDCGVSRRSPTRSSAEAGLAKSSLGRVPVTVTGTMGTGGLGLVGIGEIEGLLGHRARRDQETDQGCLNGQTTHLENFPHRYNPQA